MVPVIACSKLTLSSKYLILDTSDIIKTLDFQINLASLFPNTSANWSDLMGETLFFLEGYTTLRVVNDNKITEYPFEVLSLIETAQKMLAAALNTQTIFVLSINSKS